MQAETANDVKRKSQTKKKQTRTKSLAKPTLAMNANQLNAPLVLMPLPDDLTSKLNFISNDTAASNRLFTTVLVTKQSSLRLNRGEPFLEPSASVVLEVNTEFFLLKLLFFQAFNACVRGFSI